MPDPFPTLEEFWRRLDRRGLEDDLKEQLRARTAREERKVTRIGRQPLVVAFCARILPGSAVPPRALAAFLDEMFDRQLGRGDEQDGKMPRAELLPYGFEMLDTDARRMHNASFEDLSGPQQDEVLARAERGEIEGDRRFDPSLWFRRARDLTLLAFGSDPRGMVQMGYPGPPYKPGHVWLDRREVAARAARKKGYLDL